ncbi:MAG: LysM peptidoglycan-binding domain-containing protein [Ignavibacteria bacterium]|jgi:nucleoid-associated protein YgaU|nr:LysM peptidoglycan-binding domain-containing protein [Ignavibacteria bacterium]
MKKKLNLTLLLVFIACSASFAADKVPPPPESKPDLELTCEEADARIEQYNQRIDALARNLADLKAAIVQAETDLATQQANLEDCNKQILALIGATDADVEAFRQRLGVIEGKIRQMKGLSNDVLADRRADVVALENELNELRKEKIAVLPEFFERIITDARDIKGLYREKKISGYTVGTWAQDRDCLWNISGKTEIYGDPFQWPKIWQSNTSIIRNPDIIFPGQVLQIPPAGPKTDDEAKAERKYWRNKRAAAALTE